jgi:molybdenum-dependent DNA-binding transcriptional regulator ModE
MSHAKVSFGTARRQMVAEFERTYLLQLLERHGMDLHAAAREAQLPVRRLHAMVRKHTRPYYVERVNAFYGRKLSGAEARRIADQLLAMELVSPAGEAKLDAVGAGLERDGEERDAVA